MIKVLDNDFNRLGVIQNVISATRMENLNGENILDFESILDGKINMFVNEDSIFELDNDYFDLVTYKKQTNDDGTRIIEVEAEHISYRLNNEEYNVEYFTEMGTTKYILEKILEGTDFTVGEADDVEIFTYSAQEAKSRRQILMEFVALSKGELEFNKWTVSILKHRGSTSVKSAIKDSNVKVVSKAINKRDIDDKGDFKISYICEPLYLPANSYSLGDDVVLVHPKIGIREELRVVSISRNPYNTVDATLQFSNYINGLEENIYNIVTSAVSKDKLYNGCRIGPEYGFEAVRNDKMARAYFRSDGLVMQTGDGNGNWKDRLYYQYDEETDEVELILDGKFSTEALEAVKAYIGELEVDIAAITQAIIGELDVGTLVAEEIAANAAVFTLAVIGELEAKNFVTEQIIANQALIQELFVGGLTADLVNILSDLITPYVYSENGAIVNAVVRRLRTDLSKPFLYLKGDTSDVHYQDIGDTDSASGRYFKVDQYSGGEEQFRLPSIDGHDGDIPLWWYEGKIGGQMTTSSESSRLIIQLEDGEEGLGEPVPVMVYVYDTVTVHKEELRQTSQGWWGVRTQYGNGVNDQARGAGVIEKDEKFMQMIMDSGGGEEIGGFRISVENGCEYFDSEFKIWKKVGSGGESSVGEGSVIIERLI